MTSHKANRTTAAKALKQAQSALAAARADCTAVRVARDKTAAARDAMRDKLRDAEAALEERLKIKAAMEK
ncbi:MAG: hypothetical protein IID44_09945 [Planctomycetes bacterium]|nr:hypothetical protein [Planctomycetota bacterium]